jgi:glycosyltransferase involved in cell wall biosynthesis
MEELILVLGQDLISLCIPCMNRLHDLKKTLPLTLIAAQASPPAEVVVLDYNSSDGLNEYAQDKPITFASYTGREHYHMAHAYNLAAKSSKGDYIVIMGADAVLSHQYVVALRWLIEQGCVWMRARHYCGIVCIQRAEFLAMGGYDERFQYYMGEDKELESRLKRREAKFGLVPDGLVSVIRTPARQKLVNFGSELTKREMMTMGAQLRKEINRADAIVANEDGEWGIP